MQPHETRDGTRPGLPPRGLPAYDNGLSRFLGGSPLGVFLRLAMLSILVGFVLTVVFGLDPTRLLESIQRLVQGIWNLGFDAIRSVGNYLVLGAIIVIPIWLISRFAGAPRGR